jgi:Spy/CpxP family protein refolding chaperone
MLIASPAFAGGNGCCSGKTASNGKAMCTNFASLNMTADQKTKMEALHAQCFKGGCTKESQAKFLQQAKGILSPEQYAKLKAQCTKSAKKTET